MISAKSRAAKIFIGYFLLTAVGLTIPLFVYAAEDFFKVCWTKDQCYKDYTKDDASKKGNPQDKYEFVPGANLPKDDMCRIEGQEKKVGRCYYKPLPINLQVKIPRIKSVKDAITQNTYLRKQVKVREESGQIEAVRGFPAYLAILYTYFTAVAGIVAVAMVAYGGYQWMVAGGNAEKISQAKGTVQGAVVGLVLVLGSYVILDQINSRLVTMRNLRVDRIKPIILANKCIELEKAGIDDLVSDEDATKGEPGQAKCGLEYYSESNPDIQCVGTDCSDQLDKPYCIPDEDEKKWECGSWEALKFLCDKYSGSYSHENIDCGVCDKIDEIYFSLGEEGDYSGNVGYSIGCGCFDKTSPAQVKTNCQAVGVFVGCNNINYQRIKCNTSPLCASSPGCSEDERVLECVENICCADAVYYVCSDTSPGDEYAEVNCDDIFGDIGLPEGNKEPKYATASCNKKCWVKTLLYSNQPWKGNSLGEINCSPDDN